MQAQKHTYDENKFQLVHSLSQEGDAIDVLRDIRGDTAVVVRQNGDWCHGVISLAAGVVHGRRDKGPGDGVVRKSQVPC